MSAPDYFVRLDAGSPLVRLADRIARHVLAERGRDDLLAALDAGGGRIEDHPDGLALWIGSELVAVVGDAALGLGLRLEDARHAS